MAKRSASREILTLLREGGNASEREIRAMKRMLEASSLNSNKRTNRLATKKQKQEEVIEPNVNAETLPESSVHVESLPKEVLPIEHTKEGEFALTVYVPPVLTEHVVLCKDAVPLATENESKAEPAAEPVAEPIPQAPEEPGVPQPYVPTHEENEAAITELEVLTVPYRRETPRLMDLRMEITALHRKMVAVGVPDARLYADACILIALFSEEYQSMMKNINPVTKLKTNSPADQMPDAVKDALAVLKLGPGATIAEVKAAWSNAIRTHHSDKGGTRGDLVEKASMAKKAIYEYYGQGV